MNDIAITFAVIAGIVALFVWGRLPVELVLPAGRGVRRKRMPATLVPIGDLLDDLVAANLDDEQRSPSLRAWSLVARTAVGLVGRGRIHPAVSGDGFDTWAVGPLDEHDLAVRSALAAWLPPAAHCLAVPNRSPLHVLDPHGSAWPIHLQLPGRANKANAASSAAVAAVFGVPPQVALERMYQVQAVAGRYDVVQFEGRDLRLLLAKNPAGWLETFSLIDPPPTPVILSVNARGADGTDTSWLWDVDYTRLTGHPICVIGDRKLDLAVRLEVANQQFQVCENLEATMAAAGGTLDDICRVDVYVRNMEHFDVIHEVRRQYFTPPLPASTMVEVAKMTSPDYLIEISAIAVLDDGDTERGGSR